MIKPIEDDNADCVYPYHARYYGVDDQGIADLFMAPWMSSFFGKWISHPGTGDFALSADGARKLLDQKWIWMINNGLNESWYLPVFYLDHPDRVTEVFQGWRMKPTAASF